MSLVRAFTTRKARTSEISQYTPQRALSTRPLNGGSIRNKISAPIELVSTTNVLSYTAPDLYPSSSGDEFDVPALTHSPEPTSDNSSVGSTPSSPVEPNLSLYFPSGSGRRTSSLSGGAPKIPSRALSHTKRSHEILHRQRSMSQMSVQRKASVRSIARDSILMFSANPEANEMHPFSNELAQVTEIAEEYDIDDAVKVLDEEEQELAALGLFKFRAEDYANEIAGLFSNAFSKSGSRSVWI